MTSAVQHVRPAVDTVRQYPPIPPVEAHVPVEHARLAGCHANIVGQHELGGLAPAPRERRDEDPGHVQQKRGLNLQTQPLQRRGRARPVHRGASRLLVREQRRGDGRCVVSPGHRRLRFLVGGGRDEIFLVRRTAFEKGSAPNCSAARSVPEILDRERADRRVRRRRPRLAVERANLREKRANGERRQGLAATATAKQRQLHERRARGYPRRHPGRPVRDETQPGREPTKRRGAATQAPPIERYSVRWVSVRVYFRVFIRVFVLSGVLLERQQRCVDAKAGRGGRVRRRPPRVSSSDRVRHSSDRVRQGARVHRIRHFGNLRRRVPKRVVREARREQRVILRAQVESQGRDVHLDDEIRVVRCDDGEVGGSNPGRGGGCGGFWG